MKNLTQLVREYGYTRIEDMRAHALPVFVRHCLHQETYADIAASLSLTEKDVLVAMDIAVALDVAGEAIKTGSPGR